jgi:hypothetical protein
MLMLLPKLLPNAIIVAMIFLGRLTNIATVHPITKGILAIKPKEEIQI